MRVLVCHTCHKIEELPDFEGHPDDDVLLEYVVEDHPDHRGQLFRLPVPLWLMPGAQEILVKQMVGQGSAGLDVAWSKYYDTHNTFKEDALACYAKHLRPKDSCPDFNTKKMELKPDTKAERKDAGIDKRGAPVIHLCSFCPMRSIMENKMNQKKGIV